MSDQRIVALADVLVDYSLQIKEGDYFLIQGSEVSIPLVKEVYKKAILKGACVDTSINISGLEEYYLKHASDNQINYVRPSDEFWVNNYNAILTLFGSYNTRSLSGISPEVIQKREFARRELKIRFRDRLDEDLKWCATMFPNHSSAQEANMTLDEYEKFVYDACMLTCDDPIAEWQKLSKNQEKYCDFLNDRKTLRIKSEDTDLEMQIAGRKWINCDGRLNFPDGEVFTTPIEESVEGNIRFSYPGIYMGQEVEDIRLEFSKGKVVNATAAKGEALLNSILDTDEGARFLGEIAIGTNYKINKFTKHMLFDEKLGGTVHAAIGSAPKSKETGGKNKSAIHWDMLCNMKDGGEIYADNELFYKDGQFLI